MAVKGAKTIAEYAIRKWLDDNGFDINCFEIKFIGNGRAIITDSCGDSITLIYDSSTKQVFTN